MGQVLSLCTNPFRDEVQAESKEDFDIGLESSSTLAEEMPVHDGNPLVLKAEGHYIYLDDGRKVLDACGGAAVACIGHGNDEVFRAMERQAQRVSYVPWAFFDNQSTRDLEDWLLRSTGGQMKKVYITSSGSEAMDAAMKLAREFFVWQNQLKRVNFIARKESYHGATLGPLALGGHHTRRAPFLPLLAANVFHVSACNAYRQRQPGESDAALVACKAAELEQTFQKLGPDTVCAFVAEPVVGAASGCVTPVPGYLVAMKAVCDAHGALLILDEVMCGMGRTGSLHAWEQEGVVPDLQTVGKGLGGGYQPCSAVLVGARVFAAMGAAGAGFTHGHTYQNHPVCSAAGLAVQRIVEREGLLANVVAQGEYLGRLLKEKLGGHRCVGDVRGRGLFWGVEFVQDKASKRPFDVPMQVSRRVHDLAVSSKYQMLLYFGQGCAGEEVGDHIMVMPAYNVTRELVDEIVGRLVAVVEEVFANL